MKVVAAILAAGRGERFGTDKTQVLLNGKPLWRWSYEVFRTHPQVASVGLIGSESNRSSFSEAGADFVALGGSDRRESSRIAVESSPADADIVLIHDAARPFVSSKLISDVIEAVGRSGAAAPGLPVTDTIKCVHEGRVESLERSKLVAVQTPQGARRELFMQAHREAKGTVTDDLALLESIGVMPEIVPGDPQNIKITQASDLERFQPPQAEFRTGMGYDVHPFSTDPERPMYLGGVLFENEIGLDGHSDADVLLHAAVDALLGAAGMGDIGQHFPNTDVQWKNAPSSHFLTHTGQLLKEEGWRIENLDVTVVAERPKIMCCADSIRRHIGTCLGIDSTRVNVKATTNERLGFIGRGEGIAAFATATISRH